MNMLTLDEEFYYDSGLSLFLRDPSQDLNAINEL